MAASLAPRQEPVPTDPGFPDRVVAKAISARHLAASIGATRHRIPPVELRCTSQFRAWVRVVATTGRADAVRLGRHRSVGPDDARTGSAGRCRGGAGGRLGPAMPEKTAAFAASWASRRTTTTRSYSKSVDAVAFAVPPNVQASMALEAAAVGKHLLLDKPVADSLDDARALADEAADEGIASVVFFTHRFEPDAAGILRRDARPRAGGRAAGPGCSPHSTRRATRSPARPGGESAWAALWDVGPHALSNLTATARADRRADRRRR